MASAFHEDWQESFNIIREMIQTVTAYYQEKARER